MPACDSTIKKGNSGHSWRLYLLTQHFLTHASVSCAAHTQSGDDRQLSFFFYKEQEIAVLCRPFLSIKTLQIQQPLMELKGQRPYTGAGLHRVAQITAEVTGLVLGLIAAGQLGQALRNKRIDWCNHGKGQSPRKRPAVIVSHEWYISRWKLWVFTVSCVSSHLIIAGNSAVVSFRGQHHIQLCLVRPSLTLIPGIESQS